MSGVSNFAVIVFGGVLVGVAVTGSVSIVASVLCLEDSMLLSGSVGASDISNGVSFQQVSRMKTCSFFVHSGSKCS